MRACSSTNDIHRRHTLAQLREAEGATNKVLAARLGVDHSTLSRIEQSPNPKLKTLQAYAEALGGELLLVVRIKRPGGGVEHFWLRTADDPRPLIDVDPSWRSPRRKRVRVPVPAPIEAAATPGSAHPLNAVFTAQDAESLAVAEGAP